LCGKRIKISVHDPIYFLFFLCFFGLNTVIERGSRRPRTPGSSFKVFLSTAEALGFQAPFVAGSGSLRNSVWS
jgi:hypothetical protein